MNNQSISISYAITVCNEANELNRLLQHLQPYLQAGDEVVVQADQNHVTDEVKAVIRQHASLIRTYVEYPLNFDFAKAKNHLNQQCKGDYIFQIDADELPQPWLLTHLKAIIRRYPWVGLFKMPRINLFDTTDNATLDARTAWPDYQGRLYKNCPKRICWRRPLHERIHGHLFYWHLPKQDEYALLHIKSKQQDNAKWQEWRTHYPH